MGCRIPLCSVYYIDMNELIALQVPFLQEELLPISSFISYCKDNGVDTDQEELEYFAREELLLPAVRVISGTVEYKKIFASFNEKDEWRHIFADDLSKFKVKALDPKRYFGVGSLHYGSQDWMEWYTEHDMIRYPSKEGYIPWSTFEVNRDDTEASIFGNDRERYINASELMYSKHQIFPLKDVKTYRTLMVRNAALFRTPNNGQRRGRKSVKCLQRAGRTSRSGRIQSHGTTSCTYWWK